MNDKGSKTGESARKQARSRSATKAASDAVFAAMDIRAAEHFFAKRGFAPDTIKALVAEGITMPEELLFMHREQLARATRHLPKSALAEVDAYRQRFLAGH